jgi:hypothetical protein
MVLDTREPEVNVSGKELTADWEREPVDDSARVVHTYSPVHTYSWSSMQGPCRFYCTLAEKEAIIAEECVGRVTDNSRWNLNVDANVAKCTASINCTATNLTRRTLNHHGEFLENPFTRHRRSLTGVHWSQYSAVRDPKSCYTFSFYVVRHRVSLQSSMDGCEKIYAFYSKLMMVRRLQVAESCTLSLKSSLRRCNTPQNLLLPSSSTVRSCNSEPTL